MEKPLQPVTHAPRSRVPAAMSYHNGRSLGIFRNGEQVRMLQLPGELG